MLDSPKNKERLDEFTIIVSANPLLINDGVTVHKITYNVFSHGFGGGPIIEAQIYWETDNPSLEQTTTYDVVFWK